MTFNQWAAGKQMDNSMRSAFEAVWQELTDRGCAQAGLLLTDIFESIPEPVEGDEW